MPTDKLFTSMRNAALSTNPKEIGIKNLPEKEITVFGVIIDMVFDEGIATLVTYQTGDASMYYSFGGGFINGASHIEINKSAKELVSFAQSFIPKAAPTIDKTLSAETAVKFYLLTNKGLFSHEEKIEYIALKDSIWNSLFKTANKVISEINVHSEVKLKHKYFSATK
jgi:hypothetical protein